jgi:hypothetical protein
MGTAAMAQSDVSSTDDSTEFMLPTGWNGDIAAAFFVDDATGELRQEDEAKANYAALSDDQKAIITEHCSTMASSDAMGSDDNMTTSSTSETSATGPAEVAQVCEWAAGM